MPAFTGLSLGGSMDCVGGGTFFGPPPHPTTRLSKKPAINPQTQPFLIIFLPGDANSLLPCSEPFSFRTVLVKDGGQTTAPARERKPLAPALPVKLS
jgi:hypothetical protein